jgi:hypothetical protein
VAVPQSVGEAPGHVGRRAARSVRHRKIGNFAGRVAPDFRIGRKARLERCSAG